VKRSNQANWFPLDELNSPRILPAARLPVSPRASQPVTFGLLARLIGMDANGKPARRWLSAAVVAHLVVSIVHGLAHDGAHVPLSRAANLFVLIVVLAGPLVGLALIWPLPRIGSWFIAITMAGALIFGLVNHFVVASPDHVAHVVLRWRPLFATTAVLLAVTEALASGLAVRFAREGGH